MPSLSKSGRGPWKRCRAWKRSREKLPGVVHRRDVLWRAWVMVRGNNGAPGIDKIILAAVGEYGVVRLFDELVCELRERRYRPLPARRVLIPKPGSAEKRPLSIPVFEADFLPCSFGFRPRRSAHDALQVLTDECVPGRRWVVETNIASCFSATPHEGLMEAVEERICDQPVLKLLRAMLRAGVMEDGQVRREAAGTPRPLEPAVDLGADEGGVGEQGRDVVSDDRIDVAGADG